MDLLMQYGWLGNVRELENVLERALILTDKDIILPEHLPEQFGAKSEHRRIDDFFGTYSLKQAKVIMEKRLIQRAMEHSGGNKSKAALLLELSYPALLSKLKGYEC
jgi:two-component system response regulator AtoC